MAEDLLPSLFLSISPVAPSILLSLSSLDHPPLYFLPLTCYLTTLIRPLSQIGAAHHKRLWVVCTNISWSFSGAGSSHKTISNSAFLQYTFQDRVPLISCTSVQSCLQTAEWFHLSPETVDRTLAGFYLLSDPYHIVFLEP